MSEINRCADTQTALRDEITILRARCERMERYEKALRELGRVRRLLEPYTPFDTRPECIAAERAVHALADDLAKENG